eukprot:CAMPEP_0181111836 /NCGR_PEP_ID=MMETSP1071-20121207/19490_1 /TAXON_ID=35127 /ORGANISM="Thalassiosira sp., Strain NH16" /LENGTH=42 /DNA_ID= /DNA_START= /DNA_END= /DNA_ORIENTATION=
MGVKEEAISSDLLFLFNSGHHNYVGEAGGVNRATVESGGRSN